MGSPEFGAAHYHTVPICYGNFVYIHSFILARILPVL